MPPRVRRTATCSASTRRPSAASAWTCPITLATAPWSTISGCTTAPAFARSSTSSTPLSRGSASSGSSKSSKGFTANGSAALTDKNGNTWLPVTRSRCAKGCQGPILSAIQRFGKQGRTQKGAPGASVTDATTNDRDKWKDARNLFISIDEASNHVQAFGPNKCKIFRCVSRKARRVLRSRSPRPPRPGARAARPLFFRVVQRIFPHAPS